MSSIDVVGGRVDPPGSDGGDACRRTREVLHAYADGELDLVRAIDVERHLRQCDACGRAERCLRAVRSSITDGALYHRAPADLERRVRAAAIQPGTRPIVSPPAASALAAARTRRSRSAGARW